MILLIDNYDSFVWNLSRYFVEMGCATHVVRNDEISLDEIESLRPEAIVLSPGPCTPAEAGLSTEIVRRFGGTIPLLGVCLGHQALAVATGGRVVRARQPMHGRTSLVRHSGSSIFAGLPNPLSATRYHSLIVEEASLPDEWIVNARTADGTPMALEHREWCAYGVQFHPESVLTESGPALLRNFLHLARITESRAIAGDFVADPPADGWHGDLPSREKPLHW